MNILHVEDDIDWFKRIVEPELLKLNPKNLFHASNYDEAVSHLNAQEIDYIILDLAIPLNDSNPTSDISNGLDLAEHIRNSFEGTPLLILTGQRTEEAVEQFVEDLEVTIFWDGKAKQLVKVRPKRSLNKVLDLLKQANSELSSIEQIELDCPSCELNNSEKRVIQLFCKHNEAIAARITPISGGLSSSKVLKVALISQSTGDEFHHALAKLDSKENIDIESYNYAVHINKLPVSSFPTVLEQYFAGCGNSKGIFYQFASNYSVDYFNKLLADEKSALIILEKIKPFFEPWLRSREVKRCKIENLRQLICSDEKFNKLLDELSDYGMNVEEFETNVVIANMCIQHADLHGKNILASEELNPIVIDYGDIKEATSLLDIVTLELSPFFHPDIRESIHINIELFQNWFDDELVLKATPFPLTSKFLRAWKAENSFLKRDYVATVYSYAVRQLTYTGTNRDYAKSLIEACIKSY